MIVTCRRTGCDKTVHTPMPETEPYCGPSCARADRVAVVLSPAAVPLPKIAHLVTVRPELLGETTPDLLAVAAYELEQACVRAIADQLDPADADSAFVAELMREAADTPLRRDNATSTADSGEKSGKYARKYSSPVSVYDPPEPGWLARTLARWF